jgi:hypothetical protein
MIPAAPKKNTNTEQNRNCMIALRNQSETEGKQRFWIRMSHGIFMKLERHHMRQQILCVLLANRRTCAMCFARRPQKIRGVRHGGYEMIRGSSMQGLKWSISGDQNRQTGRNVFEQQIPAMNFDSAVRGSVSISCETHPCDQFH